MVRILLIEDNETLGELIGYSLKKEGYVSDHITDGSEGLRWALEGVYDAIILDRMLPSMDGISILMEIRKQKLYTPILMLTALGALEKKMEGFREGVDDYLSKPFEMPELLARIAALLRRPKVWENHEMILFGDLMFDQRKRFISCNGEKSRLSQKESELLEYLIRNEGQILPRALLLSRIWGPDAGVEDGSLDTYIYFLRNRLKKVKSKTSIQVVRGIGYKILKEYSCI